MNARARSGEMSQSERRSSNSDGATSVSGESTQSRRARRPAVVIVYRLVSRGPRPGMTVARTLSVVQQLRQLGIDLAVPRRPHVADRRAHALGELVAGQR